MNYDNKMIWLGMTEFCTILNCHLMLERDISSASWKRNIAENIFNIRWHFFFKQWMIEMKLREFVCSSKQNLHQKQKFSFIQERRGEIFHLVLLGLKSLQIPLNILMGEGFNLIFKTYVINLHSMIQENFS